MRSLHQRFRLRRHPHPPNNQTTPHIQAGPKSPKLLDQLNSKLPRRSNDKGKDPVRVLGEAAEDGEGESSGLAGAGAGDGEDVFASEYVGDAAALDGGGAADTEGDAGGDGPWGESEVGKG